MSNKNILNPIKIVQDDCAADAYNHFLINVKNKIGVDFNQIKKEMILDKDLGDTFIFSWKNFKITNEIGNYTIEKIENSLGENNLKSDNTIPDYDINDYPDGFSPMLYNLEEYSEKLKDYDLQVTAMNILKEIKKLDPSDITIDNDIKRVSERNMITVEKVLNLPILKDFDFKVSVAKDFFISKKYPGKIQNISLDGVNGALNKALFKNFNFKLNDFELKETHSLVKEIKKRKGLNL